MVTTALRITFTLAIGFFTLSAAAWNLPSYYPKHFIEQLDNGLSDNPLKNELFEILSQAHVQAADGDTLASDCKGLSNCVQHTSLGYDQARKVMFGRIHLEETSDGYAVRDVYCQILYTEADFKTKPPGPDKIPNGTLINTEHSWPQSHFSRNFPKDMQKSDLNILFPTNSRANSSRNNLELAEVTNERSSPCPGAKRGATRGGGRSDFFEPPDAQKGQSARAILYFAVRYKMPVSSVEEENLRKWHHQFPVNDFERSRNEQIFQAQGNRNPFIDEPDLVDRISDF